MYTYSVNFDVYQIGFFYLLGAWRSGDEPKVGCLPLIYFTEMARSRIDVVRSTGSTILLITSNLDYVSIENSLTSTFLAIHPPAPGVHLDSQG